VQGAVEEHPYGAQPGSDVEGSRVPNSPIQEYLDEVFESFRGLDDGAVASYSPALAAADPSWFGICLVSADGVAFANQVKEAGDSEQSLALLRAEASTCPPRRCGTRSSTSSATG
jgi:Glutaminase